MRKVPLTLTQFLDVYVNPDIKAGIYHVGSGQWCARADHGQLTKPDGTDTYDSLPVLLADLATVGIRCIPIEWDGLPASGRSW